MEDPRFETNQSASFGWLARLMSIGDGRHLVALIGEGGEVEEGDTEYGMSPWN